MNTALQKSIFRSTTYIVDDKCLVHYDNLIKCAAYHRVGCILESPTYTASADWGYKLGYSHDEIMAFNKRSINGLRHIADEFTEKSVKVFIAGCIGPRSVGVERMNIGEATGYHLAQVKSFALADADLITINSMNYLEEAIGILRAAQIFNIPAIIGLRTNEDNCLCNGLPFAKAVEKINHETGEYPLFFITENGCCERVGVFGTSAMQLCFPGPASPVAECLGVSLLMK